MFKHGMAWNHRAWNHRVTVLGVVCGVVRRPLCDWVLILEKLKDRSL